VVESRIPVLCFELGGDNFVVLPEHEYHAMVPGRSASGADSDLRTPEHPDVAEPGQVRRSPRKPVLLRVPTQQLSGPGGQERVPGNPPRAPRPLPGPGGLSELRHRQRGEVGRLGRNQRKGASADRQGTPPGAS
jgi:hypothetical protein